MQQGKIKGVFSRVVTPFDKDLKPDAQRFIAYCRWLLTQNCGLAVFGTTGEANSLSVHEREAMLDALVSAGLDTSRMMPGTGCCSIADTVRLTSHAVKRGCAGVLMLPPFYYKDVTENGLFRHFCEVIERVGDARLRLYLYHIPPVAIVGISPALIERLLKQYPTVISGLKDSSGVWDTTRVFLDAFGSTGFGVFVGRETFLLENMRHGGAGTISATTNVNPAATHKLYVEWKTADAERQQMRLTKLRDVFVSRYPQIAALKQTIATYGNDPDWSRMRPPLESLSAAQAETLQAELGMIGFAMPGWQQGPLATTR